VYAPKEIQNFQSLVSRYKLFESKVYQQVTK
jgi:hypothetical protein